MPDYRVLLMDAESFELYMMRLHGTATRLGRRLGAKGVLRGQVLELWTKVVESKEGSYYLPFATTVRKLAPDDELKDLIDGWYQDFKDAPIDFDVGGRDGEEATVVQEPRPQASNPVPAWGSADLPF